LLRPIWGGAAAPVVRHELLWAHALFVLDRIKTGDAENAGLEKAGPENAGP